MAKVHLVRRTRGGQKTYICVKCREPILPGQMYYHWTLYKQSVRQQHETCGYPSPTQLSNSKMAQVDEAVQGVSLGACESVEDIKSELDAVAGTANEVASEYSDAAQEAFGPTKESCETASDALETWASDLESWEPEDDEPQEGQTQEEWLESCRESAQEKLDEKPEYEG